MKTLLAIIGIAAVLVVWVPDVCNNLTKTIGYKVSIKIIKLK